MTNTGYSSTPGKHRHSLAALDAEVVRAKGAEVALSDDLGTLELAVASLAARVAALENPPTGIPPIGPKPANALLWHDFATDGMGPLVAQDYPNVHEADKDAMLGWKPDKSGRYLTQKYATDAAHVSIHDGYLDLVADRQADGTYLAALVGTFAKNNAPVRTFEMQYGTVEWAANVIGIGAASWQTPLWFCDLWNSPEIDPFEVIGKQWTANLHGSPADGQVWSGSISPGWHVYTLLRMPTALYGLIDGVAKWVKPVAMPARMPLLFDSKYGLAYPDATTPSKINAQIAWIKVTP